MKQLAKLAAIAALSSGYGTEVVRYSNRVDDDPLLDVVPIGPEKPRRMVRKHNHAKPVSNDPHPAMPEEGWPESRQVRRANERRLRQQARKGGGA